MTDFKPKTARHGLCCPLSLANQNVVNDRREKPCLLLELQRLDYMGVAIGILKLSNTWRIFNRIQTVQNQRPSKQHWGTSTLGITLTTNDEKAKNKRWEITHDGDKRTS